MLNITSYSPGRIKGLATLSILIFWAIALAPVAAEDWPEWGGKGRVGQWNETGIMEKFPADGLKFTWRKPLREGYSAPVVAEGRVYTMDWMLNPDTRGMDGIERGLCLDEKTGEGSTQTLNPSR